MVNWGNVLSSKNGQNAVKKFALGEYNCEEVQKVFRKKDRDASGDIRRLIRHKGTATARRLAHKALRRRNLV